VVGSEGTTAPSPLQFERLAHTHNELLDFSLMSTVASSGMVLYRSWWVPLRRSHSDEGRWRALRCAVDVRPAARSRDSSISSVSQRRCR
jgi:hypothetical protein